MLLLAAIAISWEDAGECELCWRLLTRIFHELPAATTDMAVFPGVLGCRPLRRTVQVRLGTNPAVPRDELPGDTPIFAVSRLQLMKYPG